MVPLAALLARIRRWDKRRDDQRLEQHNRRSPAHFTYSVANHFHPVGPTQKGAPDHARLPHELDHGSRLP